MGFHLKIACKITKKEKAFHLKIACKITKKEKALQE